MAAIQTDSHSTVWHLFGPSRFGGGTYISRLYSDRKSAVQARAFENNRDLTIIETPVLTVEGYSRGNQLGRKWGEA